jgi:hypothetical protein
MLAVSLKIPAQYRQNVSVNVINGGETILKQAALFCNKKEHFLLQNLP